MHVAEDAQEANVFPVAVRIAGSPRFGQFMAHIRYEVERQVSEYLHAVRNEEGNVFHFVHTSDQGASRLRALLPLSVAVVSDAAVDEERFELCPVNNFVGLAGRPYFLGSDAWQGTARPAATTIELVLCPRVTEPDVRSFMERLNVIRGTPLAYSTMNSCGQSGLVLIIPADAESAVRTLARTYPLLPDEEVSLILESTPPPPSDEARRATVGLILDDLERRIRRDVGRARAQWQGTTGAEFSVLYLTGLSVAAEIRSLSYFEVPGVGMVKVLRYCGG